MPAVPAPRYRLLDATRPPKPEVAQRLADSVQAQNLIARAIDASDRETAMAELARAEKTFITLASLTAERLQQLSEAQRIGAIAAAAGSRMSKIGVFAEQLSSILEKTEDSAEYKTDTAFIETADRSGATDEIAFL